jgi:uncharacterized protein (TIGR02118 family)
VLKLILLFRRAPEKTDDEFVSYWRHVHVPLVKQIPGIVRYTISPLPQSPDGRVAPFHGMAELYFESRETLDVALASPETAATGRDARNFLERGSITRLIVDEETIISAATERA